MTIWGTSHFVSRFDAINYYCTQCSITFAQAERAVDTKIREGSIHIGKPVLAPGEILMHLDDGKRYGIMAYK